MRSALKLRDNPYKSGTIRAIGEMTDTPGKIQDFVNYARSLKGYEKGQGQEFCVRLFQAFGHRGCADVGAKLEYQQKLPGQLEKKRLRHRSVLEADSMMTARLGVADAFELSWERLEENAQFLGCLLSLFASADIPWDLVSPFVGLGRFYQGQGLYDQAEPWYEQCLSLTQDRFGSDHLDIAISLNNLSSLYNSQGRYSEAESLCVQALKIHKLLLGEEHSAVAISLNTLAVLYCSQGRYSEAEPLYLQALELKKRLLGENHPDVANSLNNTALLYYYQGCYSEAERLYLQALERWKSLPGEDHPKMASSLNNLGSLYESQGRYCEAEPIYMQALELRKRLLGENHPDVANSMNNLGSFYYYQGRYFEAESLFLQALEVYQKGLGLDHPETVNFKNNLAIVRDRLNSTATDLPSFNQKAKKGGSKKKGKGFGKG